VGLELDIPGNFWGIEYAPSDWKIEELAAPAVEPQVSKPQPNQPAKPSPPRRWRLADISAGGCYLETATPFPAGTPVLMSARILDAEFLLDGVVSVSHPQTGMGVEFAIPSASDQPARVEELIRQLMNSRAVPKIFVGRKENAKEAQKKLPPPAPHAADDAESPDPLLELIRKGAALTPEQFLNDLRAQRLGKRRDPRIDLALPVLLTATDVRGRPLDQRVMTINISRRGALLEGVHGLLGPGAVVTLARGRNREPFRVAWVGAEDTPAVGQIGVAAVDPNTSFWNEVLEATAHSGLETASLRANDRLSGDSPGD
jgi:hypothetical protein